MRIHRETLAEGREEGERQKDRQVDRLELR